MFGSWRSGGTAAAAALPAPPPLPPSVGISADQVSVPIAAGGVLLGGLGAEDDGGQEVINDDDKREQRLMREMGAAELRGLFQKTCKPAHDAFRGPATLVDESDLAGWAERRAQQIEKELAAEAQGSSRSAQLSNEDPPSQLSVRQHCELDPQGHILASCFKPAAFGTHKHDEKLHAEIEGASIGSAETQADAARDLVKRVHAAQGDPSHVQHLSESGIVHAIVKWSRTGTHTERRAVANALHVITRHGGERTKDLVCDADGVKSLMRLLHEGSDYTKEMVLIALCDLIQDHKKNQSRFAEVGGIAAVMKAMTKGTPALKRAACACLCGAVSGHGNNQARAGDAGCFAPLLRLAGAGTPGQQAEALAALGALTYLNQGNQAEVAQPENLQVILKLAEPPTDSGLQARARDILRNLYDGLHSDPALKVLPSLAACQGDQDDDSQSGAPWWAD